MEKTLKKDIKKAIAFRNLTKLKEMISEIDHLEFPIQEHNDWETPLLYATFLVDHTEPCDRMEMVKELLESGADPNFSLDQKYNPFFFSCINLRPKLMELFLMFGADPHQASHHANIVKIIRREIGKERRALTVQEKKVIADVLIAYQDRFDEEGQQHIKALRLETLFES